jgi:hypothetical protein
MTSADIPPKEFFLSLSSPYDKGWKRCFIHNCDGISEGEYDGAIVETPCEPSRWNIKGGNASRITKELNEEGSLWWIVEDKRQSVKLWRRIEKEKCIRRTERETETERERERERERMKETK